MLSQWTFIDSEKYSELRSSIGQTIEQCAIPVPKVKVLVCIKTDIDQNNVCDVDKNVGRNTSVKQTLSKAQRLSGQYEVILWSIEFHSN